MHFTRHNRTAIRKKSRPMRPAQRKRFFEQLEDRRVLSGVITTSFDTATEFAPTTVYTAYIQRDDTDLSDRVTVHYVVKGTAEPSIDHTLAPDGTVVFDEGESGPKPLTFKGSCPFSETGAA